MQKLNTVGKRIEYARDKIGMERKTLAERCGISEENLKQIECSDKDEPSTEIIARIARWTKSSVYWLLTGKQNWVIASFHTNEEAIETELITATPEEAKAHLMATIANDHEENQDKWQDGVEEEDEISVLPNGSYCALCSYRHYDVIYTANAANEPHLIV